MSDVTPCFGHCREWEREVGPLKAEIERLREEAQVAQVAGARLAIKALHRYALAQAGYSWAPLAAGVEHLEGKLKRGEFGGLGDN